MIRYKGSLLNTMGQAFLTFLLRDVLLDALYAPLWWYSAGLVATVRKLMRAFQEGVAIIGISIWMRSIFKPMYGEYSWQGRIISFFMRLVVLVFMILQLIVWSAILIVLFCLWLALPLLLGWQIIRVFTAV